MWNDASGLRYFRSGRKGREMRKGVLGSQIEISPWTWGCGLGVRQSPLTDLKGHGNEVSNPREPKVVFATVIRVRYLCLNGRGE